MGIDYVIDLDCVPKQTFTTPGLLARIKAELRATAIVKLYRDRKDYRPPSEMGFEMVWRAADGSEEVQTIVVQQLLDEAEALTSLAKHCEGCPANRTGRPFGCFGNINYPVSRKAEVWLLKQLPGPEAPLVFLLLQQALQEAHMHGESVGLMRTQPGVFFENNEVLGRRLEDVIVTTDQIFEMLFLPESIQPLHAALLMLLFGAIPRDLDARQLMELTPAREDRPLQFIMETDAGDDATIDSFKAFFAALHRAHRLNVKLSLDA